MEEFFNRHGSFSTFTSRLIPAVRQFISLPAGLARMPLTPFIIYTTAGALLWVTVLAMLGFMIGDNQEAIESYLREITIATMVLIGVGTFIYIKIKDRKTN